MKLVNVQKVISNCASEVPFFEAKLSCGFPSPADDYTEKKLDLNDFLVSHPAATFFIRVEGDSMRDARIATGDMLIVDRSLSAENGKIVVAVLNGEFTVKRFWKRENQILLVPENDQYPTIEIQAEDEFQIWGVVTYVIHRSC